MLYGFDIGGTKIEMAAFDRELNQVWKKRVATPLNDYSLLLNTLKQLVNEADDYFSCYGKVGIGIPGVIDKEKGCVFSANIPAAKGQPLRDDLQKCLLRKVELENDANCFALSEAWAKEFCHYPSVLGIILGTGVGGGIVINGKVFSGLNNNAGELGHMRLPVDALNILDQTITAWACGCGQKGCIENYISGRGFENLYFHYYQQKLSAQEIINLYRSRDVNALAHCERFFTLLAICLANLFTFLDPHLVVLGGGLSNFTEIYQEVAKRLPEYLLASSKVPDIRRALYGDAGGVRGAAFLNLVD